MIHILCIRLHAPLATEVAIPRAVTAGTEAGMDGKP